MAGSLGSAVGSFLGTKLASEVVKFDTVGGQLGAAIGSSLGVLGLTAAITSVATVSTTITAVGALGITTGFSNALLGVKLGAFAGPVAAIAGAFIGFIVGGLVGSLFGGTPRSGADVVWDAESGTFGAGNGYSRKGGSKDAALSMASAVAETFNAVLASTGGRLISPEAVQAGNYGMRKSDYVYRPASTRDTDAITQRFSGKAGAEKLIAYGTYQGLTDTDFQIAGGDVYAKRALYNSFAAGGMTAATFNSSALIGNLATAQRYQTYLQNSASIKALIAAEPDSVFTAEWVLTFARAVELGLTRRHDADWYGGFGLLMEEAGTTPANVAFGFDYDPFSDRISRVTSLGDFVVGDAIDIAGQDVIEGTAGNDTIRLSGTRLAAASGATNAGLTLNGAAFNGQATAIDVAATIDAGAGDDAVFASDRGDNVLGGLGNDTLVGGKLDDWLIGGEGNDRLFAGAVATTAFADNATTSINAALAADGGSGNYLDGGAGDDRMFGSTGSDWLAGGDGLDQLHGGAGGDVLDAGKGSEGTGAAPAVRGGAGSDQYVFNRGDGQDVYFDEASTAGPGGLTGDSISAAVRARTANTLAKNWAGGGEFTVDGSTKGGDDAIVFGAGITMFHLLLERSGTAQSPGMDLIIKIQRADGTWVAGDDQITVKDWFEGTRRIEWLRFANGEELRLGDFTSFQKGTTGADVIIGTAGNDFQYGEDGDDNMWGLTGNDWQVGGRGNDAVRGNDDNDVVLGGEDNDIVLGGIGNDTASGDDGKDRVYGGAGNDLVIGGRGDDEVAGGAGDDIIKYNRGDGRDTLYDEFAGTWELVWRDGAYTNGYVVDGNGRVTKGGVTYNDGTTWIGRYDYNELGGLKSLYRLAPPTTGATAVNSGNDVLEFGTGVDIQDLVFRQEGNDLRIAITRSGGAIDAFDEVADQIRIKDWYAASPAGKSIERFQFVNTGEQAVATMNLLGGTDGADTIDAVAGTAAWATGGAGDDIVRGAALNDVLSGSSGADSVVGFAGVDVLYGGDGDDVLDGGSGADVLIGGAGSDTAAYVASNLAVTVFLDAAQGTNVGESVGDQFISIENLTGSGQADKLYGDAGGNVLDGGAGNDELFGNAGDDVYQLNTGGGADIVIDRVMSGTTTVAGAGGDDTIELGQGLSFSNITVERSGNDLVITIGTSTDKITVRDHFATTDAAVETLVTADGVTAPLVSMLIATTGTATGTAAAEFLIGRAGAVDTLDAGAGDDVLSANSGNDSLRGGDGNDVLEGGAGADTLDGGSDTISASGIASAAGNGDTARYAGSSALVSVDLATRVVSGGDAAGDVIVAVAGVSTIENVVGSAFGDTLTGDARANMLIGLAGNDTLTGAAGDDVLVGGDGVDTISGGDGADNIDAGEGDDASVRGGAGNDLIAGGGGNDTLYGEAGTDTLDGGLGNDALWGGAEGDTLGGGEGADTLQGESGDDKIAGGAGNDTLVGGDGADTLSGDTGDDTLQGGAGDDVYAFDANSGIDTIVDAAGINRIAIAGATKDRIWLTRAGADLKVGVIGGTTRITVAGYFVATGPTLMREIAVGEASLFLKYAGGLIDAMTATGAMPPATVAGVPSAVATTRDALWWAGGKAAPSAADFAISTNEDTVKTGTLAVVDHDENVNAYAVVTQAANGTVTINATTGVWGYTPRANYYGADSFVLSARDADGQTAHAKGTVTVVAVNDPPVFGSTPTLAVDENARNGAAIATLTATDPEREQVVFSITGANSPFAISAAGALTVLDGLKLDFETAATATVTVRAHDGVKYTDKPFTVTIRNVAEAPDAPVVSGTPVVRVSEPTAGAPAIASTTIATLTLTDPDRTVPSLRIKTAPAGVFAVSGSTLTFAANYAPNWETLAAGATLVDRDGDGLREVELSADVESWDGGLPSATTTRITVGIEDTNEAPTAITFVSPTVDERDRPIRNAASVAMSLGLLTAVDPDLAVAGESHVYSVTDTRFEIVNFNELRLKAGQALDYETALVEPGTGKRYVDVSVTVKDRSGLGTTKTLTQAKRIYVRDVTDYLYGTAGNDNGAAALVGQAGTDIIEGMDGDDEIYGGTGADTLYGGNGADTLRGGTGADTYYGGEGGDTVTDELEAVADTAEGGAGNDIISLGGGDDTLRGDSGDDQLVGGTGSDIVEGGDGGDRMYGEDGADTLRGGAGDDFLNGGLGADRLEGGLNFDVADYSTTDTTGVKADLDIPSANTGAAAGDIYLDIEGVLGSDGADTLLGRNAANDHLDGGIGNDEVQGRGGDDGVYGQAGDDRLYGGAGNDSLFGGDGIDTVEGGDGNDVVEGGAGADTLRGDAGFDRLTGGLGDDLLIGGAGSDTYVIARGDGNDRIDQTGAVAGDRDLIGFIGGMTNRNLWFQWVGGDVTVSVLGASAVDNTVRLLGYSANGRSNVESVIASDQQLKTKDLAIGLLATVMDRFVTTIGYRPATQAQFDALYTNTATKIDGLTFKQHWDNFWSANEAPTLAILNAAGWNTGWSEDQFNTTPFTIQVRLADDQGQLPNLVFQVDEVASEGSKAVDPRLFQSLAVTRPTDDNGLGSIAVRTRANASGTRWLWIRTSDAGGLTSERWVPVTVAPVADAPLISRAESPGGNAGSWIPVIVEAAVTDSEARVDGAESISVIGVHRLPAELQFNKGYRRGDGVWILSHGDLAGLHMLAPAGWSRDLTGADALVFDVWSQEPGNGTSAVTSRAVEVRINGAPAAPVLTNASIAENQPANSVVGQLVVNDPDRIENNPFNWNTSSIWWNESRWISTAGPVGGTVTALQTAQLDTGNGGGVHSNNFYIDPAKAYKFTVFVRPDGTADTRLYFGVAGGGFVENALNGVDDVDPYFMHPLQNELTAGRWYRLEGYVLPQGAALVDPAAYGGVYDVATGAKVQNAVNVFRWNDTMPGTAVHTRFFNYYGSAQGYSVSWYQPVVEQLPAFTLTSGAGVSVDAAGVVRLATSANYEAQANYPFSVTATDAGGLASVVSTSVTISNVNEAPYLTGGTGFAHFTETGLGYRPANAYVPVATLTMADPDGTTPVLEFGANPNNWFYIDQATKQIRFNPGLDFNFEWARAAGYGINDWNGNGILEAHVADVWVRATDGSLVSNNGLVQVFIEDVAEAPVNLRADRHLNINEDAGYHGFAWMVADDPDGQALSYAIVDGVDGGGRFSLRSDGLLIANGGYNYEAATGYTVRVRATDPVGLFTTQDFWVAINNVNERPNNLWVEAENFYTESLGAGQTHETDAIARFNMSDIDGTIPQLVIVGGNENNWFRVVGHNHLSFNWKNFEASFLNANLGGFGMDGGFWYDRDGDGAMEVRVATVRLAAQDANGLQSDPFEYKILIEDANESPYVNMSTYSLPENAPGAGNTPVGQITFSDPDHSSLFLSHSFAITAGNEAGMFSVNPTTGLISLQGALNYEAATYHSFDVSVTDAAGASSGAWARVNVTDVNEAPDPRMASQNWVARSTTFYFSVNDPDDSSGFVVSNVGSNAGWEMSGYYDAGLNRIVVTAHDPWVEYNQYRYGTIYATVTDKNGSGVSRSLSYYGHIDGPKTRPGENIPPVVLDLDRDGVELVKMATSTVKFDMDGDGIGDRTGWVAADDGFLVLDKNGSGVIDDANEFSFAVDLEGAQSDMQGLRAYDTDNDGYFDANDVEFSRFQVWQDKNQDGVSQADELQSLAERDITGIKLELDETGAAVEGATDNVVFATSEAYHSNGSTLDVADVFIAYRPSSDGQATSLDAGKLSGAIAWGSEIAAKVKGAGGKIAFAGIDPKLPLHERLKRRKALIEPVKDDVTDPGEASASAVKPQGTGVVGQPAAMLDTGTAAAETKAAATQPRSTTQQAAAVGRELAPAKESIESDIGVGAPTTRTDAAPSAAVRAAAILRSGQSGSLSAFNTGALGASDGNPVLAPRMGDTRVDQLIAAMAAFQGGGGIGMGDLSAAAPIDHLLAQLAPAV